MTNLGKTNTVLLYLSPANHLIAVRAGAENHPLLGEDWTYLGPVQIGARSLDTMFNRGCFYDPERIA